MPDKICNMGDKMNPDLIYRGTMSNACNWCGGDCKIYSNETLATRVYKCLDCTVEIIKTGFGYPNIEVRNGLHRPN